MEKLGVETVRGKGLTDLVCPNLTAPDHLPAPPIIYP